MTSNTVPIYRYGRKFYVTPEEYERIRSEERQNRRVTVLKSQQLPVSKPRQKPVQSPPVSTYIPIQRSISNAYDYRYGLIKTRHLPVNSSTNTNNPPESIRLSRSTLKTYGDHDNLSSPISTVPKKKTISNMRSHSSDKALISRKNPLTINVDDEIKRSLSADVRKEQSLSQQSKPKQQPPVSPRRLVRATAPAYGMSPTTTFSMTPNDQSLSQLTPGNLTTYFARMRQSTLNPPSSSLPSASSTSGSLFETSMQGYDQVYTILSSSSRRIGTGSSSLQAPSIIENSKNEYYIQDTTSGSFSDDTSSTLSMILQRQNNDKSPYRQSEYINNETDDNHSQKRDSRARSTLQSQSIDGFTEKKRVRFADTEGFTLEIVPDKNQLRSTKTNRLLARRQNMKVSSDSPKQKQSIYNAFYQVATKINESKLATDV